MNTDQILTDVFAERAELRPDAADVLAALRQVIEAPGHGTVARTATMLGSAAAVAAIALGVSVATSGGNGSPPSRQAGVAASGGVKPTDSIAPSGNTVPSASAPGTSTEAPVSAPSTSATGTPANTEAPVGRPYSTIAAGWLPGPVTRDTASNQPGHEERDYTVTVDGVVMDAIIYLEDGPLPTRSKSTTPYRSLLINKHPAREFVMSKATIVAVDLGNGKVAYAGPVVAETTPQVTTERITAIAERIAANMQFDRHDPIDASSIPGR